MADKIPLGEQVAEINRILVEQTLYGMVKAGGLTVAEADKRRKTQEAILATLKWLERERAAKRL